MKEALLMGAGKVTGSALRALPVQSRLAVKESLELTGQLDYSPYEIHLDLDTEIERFRLGSCRKEPETIAWLERHVRSGDIVYDVGANVGAYSLVAAHLVGATGMIYAFEPGFSTFSKLVKNIFLNRFQATAVPFNVALGERTEVGRLSYSSLRAGAALHTFGTGDGALTQPVIAFRLDEFTKMFSLREPNLLKLDVDGAELGVLRGAEVLLSGDRLRSLLVEVEEETPTMREIVDLLDRHGFDLAERHKHERSGVSNVIFSRR